jgi:glutathione S-transferase
MTDRKLTLYSNPMSRGRIAHWMMEEVGEPYDVVWLDYATTMKQPPYTGINPMGKVPALTHGDTVVTEYAAICAYMADAFPAAGLAPADRGAVYRWLFFGAGPLEAIVIATSMGQTIPDKMRGRVGYRDLATTLDVLEGWLKTHPYLAGDSFSAADVATGSQIGWGMSFGTIEARPVFADYWARVSARPALARASALADAEIKRQKEVANG